MTKQNVPTNTPFIVWSAAPTPLTAGMEIDEESVRRMVDHHLRLGVKGLFVAGTNGEGPWMPSRQRRLLLRTIARCSRKRLTLAFQVTDNSAARILENIEGAAEDGADLAVIAPPYVAPMVPGALLALYREAIHHSVLPIGIYDRPMAGGGLIPGPVLQEILAHPKVVMLKDSSTRFDRMRAALSMSRRRPALRLLNGWEFNCLPYLKSGYDGLLLGGGVFNGYLAARLASAAAAGNWKQAGHLQRRMNRMMDAVYGGKKIACWLAGEKYLLVRMDIFRTWRNYPGYPLTPTCRRAIGRVLRRDAEYLFP